MHFFNKPTAKLKAYMQAIELSVLLPAELIPILQLDEP